MKYRGSKVRQSDSASGRKLAIVVIVLTSSISFAFGYFVGRAVTKKELPQVTAVIPQQEVQEREQLIVSSTLQSQVSEEKPPADKDESVKTDANIKKEREAPPADEKKTVQKTPVYTVQAGAFKNLKDAEALKARLEKKGYKVYIKKVTASRDIKLFKVRTGEFIDRKEAEDVALRLKKDGLSAFVTPQNGDSREAGRGDAHAAKEEKTR